MKHWLAWAKHNLSNRVMTWIAWALPHDLVMWASIRLMAHATQGKWGNQTPDSVNILEALKRWEVEE